MITSFCSCIFVSFWLPIWIDFDCNKIKQGKKYSCMKTMEIYDNWNIVFLPEIKFPLYDWRNYCSKWSYECSKI